MFICIFTYLVVYLFKGKNWKNIKYLITGNILLGTFKLYYCVTCTTYLKVFLT